MAVLLTSLSNLFSSPIGTQRKPGTFVSKPLASRSQLRVSFASVGRGGGAVRAFFFNPLDESIVKEALKEPVAFMGGVFAGLLRLDLNEDPLKEWVSRTVEAAGLTPQDMEAEGSKPEEEEAPQQIEIE